MLSKSAAQQLYNEVLIPRQSRLIFEKSSIKKVCNKSEQ